MELDFDKICTIDLSPNTVLPPSRKHGLKTEKRNEKGKPRSKRKDDMLTMKEEFREITFNRYRSASCKNVPSRTIGLENIDMRRGSVYQSSKEVRRVKMSDAGERRKIEISLSNDTSVSSRIVDSLCSSDDESPCERSSVVSLASVSKPTYANKNCSDLSSSDGFFEISLNSVNGKKQSAENKEKDAVKNPNLKCDQVVAPETDGNILLERDMVHTLQKSLSAKLELPHSPPSDSDTLKASSKVRFSPIKKMLDPFMKSKSLRSPLGYAVEPGGVKRMETANTRKNQAFQKSLLDDFSSTAQNLSFESKLSKKDGHGSITSFSPAHLHGSLKLQNRQGVPYFEFSLKCPEDSFVARTWKGDGDCNWVYTFHSIDSRKRSNASGWTSTDSRQELMVGQMQVSCYLSSEVKGGTSKDSMVTEFVLYDIAHARSSTAQEPLVCSPNAERSSESSAADVVEGDSEKVDTSQLVKCRYKPQRASERDNFESSDSTPWPSVDLLPDLEIAAIVIDVPLENRESLKFRRGDDNDDEEYPNLLSLAMIDQSKTDISYDKGSSNVKVIAPTGNHGVPNNEYRGPSSLLDRWRYGGGCDCGGWDMGCPLTVLNNPFDQCSEALVGTKQPFNLHVQGARENTPALTLTVVKEGDYAVDFHAQLSSLQAFAICVAILHSTETSITCNEDGTMQLLPSNSLKMLIKDEVKFFVEAVTGEEKRKIAKQIKDVQPSFALNPPFSPIGRV